MAAQVRPESGGAWNSVSVSPGRSAQKHTNFGFTMHSGARAVAVAALNQWINCGGVGTHAVIARKRLKSVSLQVQEA